MHLQWGTGKSGIGLRGRKQKAEGPGTWVPPGESRGETFIEYVSMLSTCLVCVHVHPPKGVNVFTTLISQQATNTRLRLPPVHQEPPAPISSPTISLVDPEPQMFPPTISEALTRQAPLWLSLWPVPTHTVAPEHFIPFLWHLGEDYHVLIKRGREWMSDGNASDPELLPQSLAVGLAVR